MISLHGGFGVIFYLSLSHSKSYYFCIEGIWLISGIFSFFLIIKYFAIFCYASIFIKPILYKSRVVCMTE